MRNMSFSKTVPQMRARTKFVTRRYGWWFLKPGDRVQAVEKCMGLKKGEKVKKICVIQVFSTQATVLNAITHGECIAEGFPEMSCRDLRELIKSMCPPHIEKWWIVNRIEFRYV